MANKNSKNRRNRARQNKRDTDFKVESTKGDYTITVSVKSHARVSKRPKVAGRGAKQD